MSAAVNSNGINGVNGPGAGGAAYNIPSSRGNMMGQFGATSANQQQLQYRYVVSLPYQRKYLPLLGY